MKAISTLSPSPSLEDVRRYVEDTFKVFNSISFGDGTNRGEGQNLDLCFVSGTSNAVANTETVFSHVLDRVPVGYIIVKKDKAGIFFNGATAWTKTGLSLKCNVTSVAFTAILF